MTNPFEGFRALAATPQVADLRNRHRDFYRGLAAQTSEAELDGLGTPWVDLLEADLDNLRAAIEWSLTSGGAPAALEIACGCQTLWEQGRYREGRQWLGRGLAAESVPTSTRAAATLSLSAIARLRGEAAEGDRLADEALNLARQGNDDVLLARCLRHAAWMKHQVNDPSSARPLAEEAIEVARRAGRLGLLVHCLRTSGWLALSADDPATALERHRQAMELVEGADPAILMGHLGDYAGMLEMTGHSEEAAEALERAIALRRSSAVPERAVHEMLPLGRISLRLGHIDRARELFAEVASLSAGFADKGYPAGALVNLAELDIEKGDMAAARSHLLEAVDLVANQALEPGLAAHYTLSTALDYLAEIAEWEGDQALARRYLERRLSIPRPTPLFRVAGFRRLSEHAHRLGDIRSALRFAAAGSDELERAGHSPISVAQARAVECWIEEDFAGGYAVLSEALEAPGAAQAELLDERGIFALRAGHLEAARANLEDLIRQREGWKARSHTTKVWLAEVDLAEGNAAAARASLRLLVANWRRFWPVHHRIALVETLARATVADGDHLYGAELLGVAHGESERVGHVKPRYLAELLKAAAAEARAGLGDDEFGVAFERGRRTPIEHALDRESQESGA